MRHTVYMNNPQSCGLDPVGFKTSAITLVEGTSTFVPELLLEQAVEYIKEATGTITLQPS